MSTRRHVWVSASDNWGFTIPLEESIETFGQEILHGLVLVNAELLELARCGPGRRIRQCLSHGGSARFALGCDWLS